MQDKDHHLQLYLAHRAALVEFATPLVGDRMRAEDVVQEAFLRLRMPKAGDPGWAGVEQPVAYLYRIVRNLALDWRRRRTMEARHQDGEGVHWLRPATPRTPEQDLAHSEDLRRIAALLDDLSPEARIAVEMHRFGGYTLEEIATRLGMSVSAAHRLVGDAVLHVVLGLESDD